MQNGQLLEEGSVLDIFSNPQEDLTQEFIETAQGLKMPWLRLMHNLW